MTKPAIGSSSSPEGHSKIGDVVGSVRTTISPIRAFATRQQLQKNSNASLTHDDGLAGSNASTVSDPAVSILDAISKLESIMEEAVKLAQLAGETDPAFPQQPAHIDNVRLRRPSSATRSKGLQYLDHAGDHIPSPLHRALHGDKYPAKAGLASPQLTASTAFSTQIDNPPIDDQVERTNSGFEVLPPRPSSAPPSRTSISKRRTLPSKAEIKTFIRSHAKPPISARFSSRGRPPEGKPNDRLISPTLKLNDEDMPGADSESKNLTAIALPKPHYQSSFSRMFGVQSRHGSLDFADSPPSRSHAISLSRLNHVDIRNKPDNFDVYDTCTHASVARDWPTGRKRFMAAVVCINTICVGILIGIYAGEVPAIQYRLADFHHFAILGNVVLYSSLAISTLLFWPLPLLHGRKVYTVLGFVTAFGLQIPQGLAVEAYRYPDDIVWRVSLMLSRCVSGFVLGFVNINLHATLLDLFGSSLQSQHPHGEVADPYDARRHGGGIGMWLAAWSWCTIGSISFGFTIGAFIIEKASADWGFWTSLALLMFVVTLNMIAPEVRRSAFRRTLADFIGVEGAFSRVARGEIKMHLMGTGPYWWGEEVQAGLKLSWSMVKQPGFFIVALYAAWAYAQFTLILMVSLLYVCCSC
jgi:hypothetical protein